VYVQEQKIQNDEQHIHHAQVKPKLHALPIKTPHQRGEKQ
jgi:hypothetical protein